MIQDVIMREMGAKKGQGGTAETPVQHCPRPWHPGRSGFM
jgi:hypothetical protein